VTKCYVWIRLDPDVPREGQNDKSDRQLSTAHTRTHVGMTEDKMKRTRRLEPSQKPSIQRNLGEYEWR